MKIHTKTKSGKEWVRGPYKNNEEYCRQQKAHASKEEIQKMKSAANTKGLKENLSKEFVKEFDDYFKEKNDIMTVDDVVHLVNDAALSKNQILTILRTISNQLPNHQLTTPRIKEALEKRKLLFEDFITTEFMDFLDKNGKPLNRAVKMK